MIQRRSGKDKPDSHREYLDAESSNEVKYLEEQQAFEEHYEIDELERLVTLTKNLVTVNRLKGVDWTDECVTKLKEFFQNTLIFILTVFLKDGNLVAELDFPVFHVEELCCLVKNSNEKITIETFEKSVTIMTINNHVEEALLRNLEHALGSMFYKEDKLFNNMGADYRASLQDTLCKITDFRYKMLGFTVLYLPPNIRKIDRERIDEESIKQLKAVVSYWTKQIKVASKDTQPAEINKLFTLVDEFAFWNYRRKNLLGLREQLQGTSVQQVVSFFKNFQSTNVEQFRTVIKEVENAIEETESNIEFLGMLKNAAGKLDSCTSPTEISCFLPEIIRLLTVTWIDSPFLNKRDKMTRLFSLLSNHIIAVCKGLCDLKAILGGQASMGIQFFQECIKICEEYASSYKKHENAHNKLTSRGWSLNTKQIFLRVEIFIRRCSDMLEICYASMAFMRMDEIGEMPEPKFSGTKGAEFESVCENVLKEHLQWLKSISSKVLDVFDLTWVVDMLKFSEGMMNLEAKIKNLAIRVFEYTQTVEDAIINLHPFHAYRYRDNLKEMLDEYVAKIWSMFLKDIRTMEQTVINEKANYLSSTLYFSGRASHLRLKLSSLRRTKEIIEDTKWFPYCSSSEEANRQYEGLLNLIELTIRDLYREWIEDIGDNPKGRLDRYLMRRSSPDKHALLEGDIDPVISKLCREADHWLRLDFDVPTHIRLLHGEWASLQFLQQKVLLVVASYNDVLKVLLSEENGLFLGLIRKIDEIIKAGLKKFTWKTKNADVFLDKCIKEISKLQDFIENHQNTSKKITEICADISNISMIRLSSNHSYTLSELTMKVQNMRDYAGNEIMGKYSSLLEYLTFGQKNYSSQKTTVGWGSYLDKVDAMLQEAFRTCLENSLNALYDIVRNGDLESFITIDTVMQKDELTVVPSHQQVTEVFENVFHEQLKIFEKDFYKVSSPSGINRISEKFGAASFLDMYKQDDILRRSQKNILSEIDQFFEDLKKQEAFENTIYSTSAEDVDKNEH